MKKENEIEVKLKPNFIVTRNNWIIGTDGTCVHHYSPEGRRYTLQENQAWLKSKCDEAMAGTIMVGQYDEAGKRLDPNQIDLSEHYCPLLDTPTTDKRGLFSRIYYWVRVKLGHPL